MKHACMAGALLALWACADDDQTSSSGTSTSGSGGGWQEIQGGPCPANGCPEPLECLSYCGFSGCNDGMMFESCEIPCGTDKPMCPDGQVCGSIADGPGDVCMPE